MINAIVLLLVFLAAVMMTGMLRRYAYQRSVLDVPSARSSHTEPTPRGGGLSIVLCFFSVLLWVTIAGDVPLEVAIALCGGVAIALIGWIDDHRHVSAASRAVIHGLAAGWVVYWLGPVYVAWPSAGVLGSGWVSGLGVIAALVWLTNLYNFMDGIDGIAGTQTVTAGLGGGMLLWWGGHPGPALLSVSIAVATLGFLVWNWPPAKIFMGDVGSGFVGYSFGVIALSTTVTGQIPLAVWLILLAVFIGDATYTLMRRVVHRERWYEAHRSHAYQRLTDLGLSHRQVTTLCLLLNLLCLWPLAWAAWRWPAASPFIAVGVMVAVWLGWKTIHTLHRIQYSRAEPLN